MRTPARCLLTVLLGAALALRAQASATVTLAWDPSPSSGIAGYLVYVGGASRTYTNVISVRNTTSAAIPGLARGGTYFFTVTSYNTQGLESAFSKEVSCTIPTAISSPPTIELTSPVNGAVHLAPANITLSASAVGGGQAVKRVEFYHGAVLLGVAATAPYTICWSNVSSGNFSVRAVAVYQFGGTLASAAANVMVAAGQAPSAVSFAADSGVISSPFLLSNGTVYQSAETRIVGGGRAAYTFSVAHAGSYTVSAMVRAPDEGMNSFYVNVDAEPVDPLMIWDIPTSSTYTRRTVSWRGSGTGDPNRAQYSPKVFFLSAGKHQLIIRGREAYTRLGAITVEALPPTLQIQPTATGAVLLSGTGQAGQPYLVLGSEDFTAWKAIGTVTADAQGRFQFSDPISTGQTRRLYRLLSIAPRAPSLRITSAASGGVSLSAVGQPGQTYTVQCSQDLRQWTDVGTITLDLIGNGAFAHPAAGNRSQCFHRLKAP